MSATGAPTTSTQTEEAEHLPGEADMWFFVLFESLVFTSYLGVYLYFRTQHEGAFLHAQLVMPCTGDGRERLHMGRAELSGPGRL